MLTWENSVFINRPQQEVWDFISDPANFSHLSRGNEPAEWTSEGPPGVGSTLLEAGKVFGRRMEGTSMVTVWDPPNQFSRKYISGAFQGDGTMKFESKGNGTQFTAYGQVELGVITKIAGGLLSNLMKKQLDAEANAFKHLLETGQAQQD
jgi:carbon monoxide dehydrogenase subunit G